MILVYCAGAYNADDVIGVLGNMRRGIQQSVELLKEGFAVVCPWLDFQFGLHANIDLSLYRRNSMEQLRRCDCVFLVDRWTNSEGTKEELAEAKRLKLPIFQDVHSIWMWRANRQAEERKARK